MKYINRADSTKLFPLLRIQRIAYPGERVVPRVKPKPCNERSKNRAGIAYETIFSKVKVELFES